MAKANFYEQGSFRPGSHGEYPEAVRRVGIEMDVPVADLTTLTENYIAQLGDEASRPLFVWPVDNTHLKPEGAIKMVSFLCDELRKFGKPYSELLYRPDAEEAAVNDEVF